jgi:hypothetical protein
MFHLSTFIVRGWWRNFWYIGFHSSFSQCFQLLSAQKMPAENLTMHKASKYGLICRMKYSGFMTVHINTKEIEIYVMCLINLKHSGFVFTTCFVMLNLYILLALCRGREGKTAHLVHFSPCNLGAYRYSHQNGDNWLEYNKDLKFMIWTLSQNF